VARRSRLVAVCFVLPVVALGQTPAPTHPTAGDGADMPRATLSSLAVPHSLSLHEAKALALRDNPGMAAAAHRVDAAAAVLRQAQSAYYPVVSLGGNALAVRETPGHGAGDTAPYEVYDLNGTVTWLIFDGFARGLRVEAARHAEAGAGEDHRQARRLLVQGTALAFLNALLAEESMRIARQDADFNRELSNETRKRFDVGTAAKSEVLNFDIRTTQAESRHIAAELAFRSAKTALPNYLGGLPRNCRPIWRWRRRRTLN
jgi:outer membrane protein TolC